MASLHISVAAETLTKVSGISITNSLLTTWLVMIFVIALAFIIGRRVKAVPGLLQNLAELMIGGLYDLFSGIVGEDKIKTLAPLLLTFFIFILFANWSGLIPGLAAVGLNAKPAATEVHASEEVAPAQKQDDAASSEAGTTTAVEEAKSEVSETHEEEAEFLPLFRGPTADLSTTLALALISVGAMVFYGIKFLGLSFFKRYLNFTNPIMVFVGILEFVSDISKILSFAFRLFGNIFAGEVLLTVIGFLVPVIAPIPFLGLELFVGVIQALVFSLLTAAFISMAATSHGDHSHQEHAHA